MTTDELFAEMERLEAAATPGAVEAFDPNESVAPPHWHIANDSYSNPDDGPAYCAALECGTRDDALFDEFLRNHAPGLIRSLRQERDDYAKCHAANVAELHRTDAMVGELKAERDALARRVAELEQRS